MNGPIQANRYQQRTVSRGGVTIRGIYVVRLLVGLLLALDIALVLTIIFSPSGIQGFKQQNRQVKKLEDTVLDLRTQNQNLFERIQSLKNDPKAQERLVRRQLGWVGKNEIIFQSPDSTQNPSGKPITPFDLPK
jgi:cell division protein FtsB